MRALVRPLVRFQRFACVWERDIIRLIRWEHVNVIYFCCSWGCAWKTTYDVVISKQKDGVIGCSHKCACRSALSRRAIGKRTGCAGEATL